MGGDGHRGCHACRITPAGRARQGGLWAAKLPDQSLIFRTLNEHLKAMQQGVAAMVDQGKISADFDFEFGHWQVRHRRLKERLVGCTAWEEFPGQSDTRAVLGGNGNIEDNILHFPSGPYRAIAIRSYDPDSQNWAIWWLSSTDPHHLDVPVVGRFNNGVGAFFAQDFLNGRAVTVRFLWLKTETQTPRWEQAMSADAGATWETNWTMDFTRA
jgi:hypothetical protein